MNYQVIEKKNLKNEKQYQWFHKFSNPCYGFNVKMDVTEVVRFSKETHTSFFINVMYVITKGMSSVDNLRMREVRGEIRLYEAINPTFTVMTQMGEYENAGFDMVEDYATFYERAHAVIEDVKCHETLKESFNDSDEFADYYMTCIPWLSVESMTHPLIDNDYESLSCPRVCWDKYREENGRYVMTLNITVNHCFVDGQALSQAFLNIQKLMEEEYRRNS